jgi:putative CocE/NonD family hydrolase
VDLEVATETLREGLIWFDAHLKGDFSRLRKAPVSIYIMQVGSYGPGEWREMESWPPAIRPAELYLQDHGRLERSPAGEYSQPSRYIYDPADPTPVVGGSLMNWHAGPRDNRRLEARPDVLTYTTSPLGEDLEVIGAPRLRLYVKTSHPYVDLIGRLCVVSPTGESLNLCDGFLRLKPGDGDPQPDGSLRLEIELWPTANRFLKGTAIRLQISSGAFPRWNRNLGSGEPIATGTRLVPCEVTIFQDARHPSTLTLPVSA